MAVDSSVVVAGFAAWHEHHEPARRALDRAPRLIAHCALESYSVLTRLPSPHRAPAALVRDFLVERFQEPYLSLPPDRYGVFIDRLARDGIAGGATYDALMAVVANEAGATLLTADQRAAATYQRLGTTVRFVA
jgi:predicted nucleic acid-binding protein